MEFQSRLLTELLGQPLNVFWVRQRLIAIENVLWNHCANPNLLAEQFSKIHQRHQQRKSPTDDTLLRAYSSINGTKLLCLNSDMVSVPRNIFRLQSNRWVLPHLQLLHNTNANHSSHVGESRYQKWHDGRQWVTMQWKSWFAFNMSLRTRAISGPFVITFVQLLTTFICSNPLVKCNDIV